MATATTYLPPGTRPLIRAAEAVFHSVVAAGHMMHFFGRVMMSIPIMLRSYRKELSRLLADIAWGNGSIVVGGGTVGVALVLGFTIGALIGIEGYSALDLLGLGPATGLISSFVSTRELAPIMVGLAFTTQAGCRFTAQLGAMRINEEIDAVESLAVNPIPFLVTTRVVASMVAVIPLFLACLAVSYLAAQLVVQVSSGQSAGSYMHYFASFVNAKDVGYATIKAVCFVSIASTIQCYYGYHAAGGPAGVGVAAGRAMRATITAIIIVNMLLTMIFWGVESGARFGG